MYRRVTLSRLPSTSLYLTNLTYVVPTVKLQIDDAFALGMSDIPTYVCWKKSGIFFSCR